MLSVILPTYNESANLPRLIPLLEGALSGTAHEIIVVDDDSPDGTWKIAEELSKKHPSLRVLRRVGRRGLSSAVTEGFAMAKGEVLMVMDSDGQHDVSVAPALYGAVKGGATVAVASRYVSGGDLGGWKGIRPLMSKTATALARRLPRVRVSDPMSGFFALDAHAYRAIAKKLHPRGFKILLEILRYLPSGSKTADVPLTFKLRTDGKSKMNFGVHAAFLGQISGIAADRLRLPWSLFWLLCLAAAATLLPRAWALRDLYLDPSVRAQAQQVLTRVSSEQGWLLSDIELVAVHGGVMTFLHRTRHRGFDESECFRTDLANPALEPCAD